MGDFTTKKRFILALLALLLAMDGALAFHNSRLSVKEVNPDARLKAESLKVALVRADIERANKIKARLPEVRREFSKRGLLRVRAQEYAHLVRKSFEDASVSFRSRVNGRALLLTLRVASSALI